MREKIDIRELRVGSIIYQGKQYGNKAITAYELYQYQLYLEGAFVADYYSEWECIPLTEELLLKFGFEKDKHYNHYSKTYYSWASWEDAHELIIRLGKDERATIEAGRGNEVYVGVLVIEAHQLQDLWYALTGTELVLTTEK